MWYMEELLHNGWHPRATWGQPRSVSHQGDRPATRGIVKVSAEHETLSLDELAAIYGTKAEAQA